MTGQGIRWKKGSTGTIKFVDYRFVKDLELRSDTCCCCCVRSELEIYADHKDSVRYSVTIFLRISFLLFFLSF